MKGRRIGFSRSLIRMAKLLASAFIAAFASILAAKLLVELVYGLLDYSGMLTELSEYLGDFSEIIYYILQMIISLLLFVPLFGIVNLVASLVILIVVAIRAKRRRRSYCSERSPYYAKRDKLLGGIFGAVGGIFISIVVLSPITGTLRCLSEVTSLYTSFSEEEELPEELAVISEYANDSSVVLIDNLGGGAFFNLSTTVFCYGDNTNLRSELATLNSIDLNAIEEMASSISNLDGKAVGLVEDFINLANHSPFLRFMLCSSVQGMATAWLNENEYMGISRPDPVENGAVKTFMNSALRVLSNTDMDNVHMDVITFVHICEIFVEHAELLSAGDYSKTIEALLSGSLVDSVDRELALNPNMKPVRQALDSVIMQTISEEILSTNYTIAQREELFSQLSDALNDTIYLDADQRHKVISEEVISALESYGISIEDGLKGLPDKISSSLITQVVGSGGNVSKDDIENYFNSFINKYK